MTTSKNLIQLFKPLEGEQIPLSTLTFMAERNRNKAHDLVLSSLRESGISQAELARRLDKRPEVVNRWIGAPGNWTLDTVAQLLFAINGTEVKWEASDFLELPKANINALGWLYDEEEEEEYQLYNKIEKSEVTTYNPYKVDDIEAVE